MNPKINKYDIEFLIDCLKNGKEIPEVYKYALFPTKQKEYELVYAGKMRKEDVLADTEEAKPVPLQIEKVFNGKKYPLYSKDWHNLLVFGDNLQILKTFNENKDPLVKNKIKGNVKLIYIDPPFATEQDFQGRGGESAYSDKKKGADFIEFLRRRILVAKELLAPDGTIYVHVDSRKGHFIKVMLDEILVGMDFAEIVWVCGLMGSGKFYPKSHELLFCYKSPDAYFNPPARRGYSDYIKNDLKKDINGWYYTRRQESSGGKKFLKTYICDDLKLSKEEALEYAAKNRPQPAWSVWVGKDEIAKAFNDYGVGTYSFKQGEGTGYPTQKPEELISRIVQASSQVGDLVMDFFAGSGTTLVVAEKLGRRWVGCDIGKLAIYTTQKRLLEIAQGKDLSDTKKKYDKPANSFAVVTSGLYDLGKIFTLQKDEYIRFVKDLFEIEETKTTKISGVEIDGKKREFYAKIFPYWKLKNVSVDEKYLQELHKNIGGKIDGRFYIIAPANNVNFISDYHQIGNVRYYFLKVPYQIIKELHKVQFKKFRQPQSKSQINDLDEAIGFHFIRQPEVKSEINKLKDKAVLKIKKFESAYSQDETGEKLKNFESLAMLLVDLNYDGEIFMMTNYFFAQDLLNSKKNEKEESEEEIKKKLIEQKEIIKEFPKKDCGKQIMAIYVDIYGNEFREVFKVK
jgi:site-specific DNA-methyltransferase (adenine-specific)/adenine-specific DNA-methyltransferase